ncbi:MAG TPA: hypothetical protein VGM08_03545 [Candidatus Saccharimonadales bacterium]|jgi:hypothetical protein
MKKLALTLATLGVSLVPAIPAVSASAMAFNPNTTIASSQNRNNTINARRNNSSSSSNVSYYNATVNYLAVVKYSASVTSYNASTQNNNSSASLFANSMNNSRNFFTTPTFVGTN